MNLFKIELYKYLKSKTFLIFSLVLIISFITPVYIYKSFSEIHPLFTYHDSYTFNIKAVLPIFAILHFTYFMCAEFNGNKINLLLNSVYSKERIILTKFLVATITFGVILFIANIVVVTFIFILYGEPTVLMGGYGSFKIYNLQEIIGVILIVNFFIFTHFITWGSIAFALSIILKNRVTSFILTMAINILIFAVNIPDKIKNYTFIDGYASVVALLDFNGSFFYLMKVFLSSISFIAFFLLLSVNYFKYNPSKRGAL